MHGRALYFVVCGMTFAALVAGCNRNQPPASPMVTGPSTGKAGATLAYTFSSADPDNDDIEYMVAWGDTSAVEWSALYPSGQSVTRSHVFADTGVYRVSVKARDTKQVESEWSDSLDVSIALEPGGPPLGLSLVADTDSTVTVLWSPPEPQSHCLYQLYFRGISDSAYTLLTTTVSTMSKHIPHGATGRYKVAAKFENTVYESPTVLSTVPIRRDATIMMELNADPGRAGYGWNRDSGVGGIFSMADSANCGSVDFYISDLQVGVGGELNIVSPDKAKVDSLDPGALGIVPAAAWRINGFSNPLPDPQSPLPAYQPPPYATYFIYTRISSQPCYISCYTAGDTPKHYALVQVDSVDVSSGRVWIQSWYQLVPGLRLIRH